MFFSEFSRFSRWNNQEKGLLLFGLICLLFVYITPSGWREFFGVMCAICLFLAYGNSSARIHKEELESLGEPTSFWDTQKGYLAITGIIVAVAVGSVIFEDYSGIDFLYIKIGIIIVVGLVWLLKDTLPTRRA